VRHLDEFGGAEFDECTRHAVCTHRRAFGSRVKEQTNAEGSHEGRGIPAIPPIISIIEDRHVPSRLVPSCSSLLGVRRQHAVVQRVDTRQGQWKGDRQP
jgi:hypothetical protein